MTSSHTTGILFVCLGNICRSPTAEAIMAHRLGFEDLGVHVEVESAGTGDWHVGHPPDERARDEATRRGVPMAGVAQQFTAADFDRFAWLRPTFLPVVAAGNAGAGDVGAASANLGNAVGTVSSPAVAKNCLAVAATLTEPFEGSPEREEVGREKVTGELLVAAVTGGVAGANQARRGHRAVAAIFSSSSGSSSSSSNLGVGTVNGLPPLTSLAASASGDWALVAADPIDACLPLKNGNLDSTSPSASAAVVFAWRGRCSFATKAANAAAAGAAALLIANSGPGGALRMTGTPPTAATPLAPRPGSRNLPEKTSRRRSRRARGCASPSRGTCSARPSAPLLSGPSPLARLLVAASLLCRGASR